MMRGSGFARVPRGARRGDSGYGVESGIGFGVSGLTLGLYNLGGGRYWTRTSDLTDVNRAL
jgi:hypothetical protein